MNTPDTWKFPTPVARLYSLIDKQNAVRTEDGIGTLIMAHSYSKGCMVSLSAERQSNRYQGGKDWKIARYYDAEELEPANQGKAG